MRPHEALTPITLLRKLLRIVWARRVVLAVAAGCTVLGGFGVLTQAPAIYSAKARVILDMVKLDEQTGAPISRNFAEPYVANQLYFLRDVEVTGRVAERLGWLDDPDLIDQYNNRPPGDDRDMRAWVAQRLTGATSVGLVPDSNVLEITYRSFSPDAAVQIVDEMRRAYVEASLQTRRDAARKEREWFDRQAGALRDEIQKLALRREQLQRETGITFKDEQTDLERVLLKRMMAQQPVKSTVRTLASPYAVKQAQLNARLAEASRSLGPNNPELAALRRQRDIVDAQVNAEQQQMQAAVAQAMNASQQAVARIDVQRQRVTGQADSIALLRQVQDQITVVRDLYERVTARSAELQQKAEIADSEVIPIGEAEAEPKPYFPNKSLILAGTTVLGLAFGVCLSLLIELLSRRVRGERDLASATGLPVLATLRLRDREKLLDRLMRKPSKRAPTRSRSKMPPEATAASGAS